MGLIDWVQEPLVLWKTWPCRQDDLKLVVRVYSEDEASCMGWCLRAPSAGDKMRGSAAVLPLW